LYVHAVLSGKVTPVIWLTLLKLYVVVETPACVIEARLPSASYVYVKAFPCG
jgi:hypothetical protein